MNKVKYSKTFHLPFSPGTTSEDRFLPSIEPFEKMNDIVVTEKLDGENSGIYKDHFHARSLDSRHHDSRNWIKALWGSIKHEIPDNYRICGENVYAEHSIRYDQLTSFFYVFAIFEQTAEGDFCLAWDDIVEICKQLNIEHVPVLYRGPWDLQKVQACMTGVSKFGPVQEGYVVRNANRFKFEDFQTNVAKFVRKGHVQTSEHWSINWRPNKMKQNDPTHLA